MNNIQLKKMKSAHYKNLLLNYSKKHVKGYKKEIIGHFNCDFLNILTNKNISKNKDTLSKAFLQK